MHGTVNRIRSTPGCWLSFIRLQKPKHCPLIPRSCSLKAGRQTGTMNSRCGGSIFACTTLARIVKTANMFTYTAFVIVRYQVDQDKNGLPSTQVCSRCRKENVSLQSTSLPSSPELTLNSPRITKPRTGTLIRAATDSEVFHSYPGCEVEVGGFYPVSNAAAVTSCSLRSDRIAFDPTLSGCLAGGFCWSRSWFALACSLPGGPTLGLAPTTNVVGMGLMFVACSVCWGFQPGLMLCG